MTYVTHEMIDDKVRGRVRINLHVHAIEGGKQVYHVIHVGFFRRQLVKDMVASIDAAGLAYRSIILNQTGRVDVAVCLMQTGESEVATWRHVTYEPPVATRSYFPRKQLTA